MLSEVIAKHKKQQQKEELAQKEQEARKYIDEYDNLKTRHDVLQSKFPFPPYVSKFWGKPQWRNRGTQGP